MQHRSSSSIARWFGKLFTPAARATVRRARLAFDVLEDRTVPSPVTVTSASDDPSDTGSLRYALDNATPGEVIDFAPNVRTIDLSNTLNSTGLAINVNLSIINDQGVGPVTINGGGVFTVFTMTGLVGFANSVTASLSGLTIANGNASNEGGGIYNEGTLTVSNCDFSGNYAGSEGGGICNNGTLTVSDCNFTNNSVHGYGGGGIFNNSTLTVTNCTFSNNSTTAYGGGLYNDGMLNVGNSTFSNNSAGDDGGGIDNNSLLTLGNCTFSNNSTAGSGGGLYNTGGALPVSVTESTFFANSSTSAANNNGGGGIWNSGTLTVSASTFSANSTGASYNGGGGGIYNSGTGTLAVSESTFSANLTGGHGSTGGGGGILTDSSQPPKVTLNGDIFSGDFNTYAGTTPDDIAGPVEVSSSDNLIGTGGSGGLVNGVNGNQVGVSVASVGLVPLANNGGPTETMAIGPGSLAIGTGYAETTATTDQRGVARPINEPSDVGAFQYSAVPTVASNPTSQVIIVGQNASFSATATGGAPAPTTVQWQISTDDGNSFTNLNADSTYGGVASTTLTITSAPVTLSGDQYRAVFSNAAGLYATTTAATLTVENPTSVVPFLGALQSATVASTFEPLEAFVTDNFGNPVSGASVIFAAVPGANGASGSFGGSTTVITNSHGIAISPALTAGDTAGAFTVTASVNGVVSPADFNLTNTPGSPATITAVGGSSEGAPIGAPFDNALQAKVVDAFGNPLGGVPVTFSAPLTGATGTFRALTTVPTNALGIAMAPTFTANHIVGSYSVTATSKDIAAPATFTLTNTTVPAAIATYSATAEHASVNSAFTTPLEVRVTNAAGSPVVGITVDFELSGGAANGTFAGSSAVATNANGVATAPTLTANTVAGSFTVSAWVGQVKTPATFSLTNLPLGPSAVNVIAGSGQAAALGIAYAKTLQAEVVDKYGNPLSGVTVTFHVPTTGASGTFAGRTTATAVTGANGIATIAITANSTPGNFQATASVAQVATPATFSLTNSPIHALKVVAGSPQNATTNTAYGTALQVKATDAAGNPLQGVSITFTTPSSGASGTFASSATVLTGANGIAIAPAFTANGVAGSFNVTASLTSAVAGVTPVTFTLKNMAPSHGVRRALLPLAHPVDEL